MKLDAYESQAARHILVYGPPKIGKTVLVGKLASRFKLWWFDLEDGVKSLMNPAMLDPQYRKNIELFSIADTQMYPMAIEAILKVIKGGLCKVCEAHSKVNCATCIPKGMPFAEIDVNKLDVTKDIVVIDSWSQLVESCTSKIMAKSLAKDDWETKPGWDEYNQQMLIMNRIGSIIQVAPFNVVVTSHEEMIKMEDGTNKLVPVGGTANYSKRFARYFDDICYLDIVNRKHVVYSDTLSKPNVMSGSRTGINIKGGEGLERFFTGE